MNFLRKLKALLLFAPALGFSQITVYSGDFATANDSVRISVKNSIASFNPTYTGPNYTWDYSFLIPDSQRVAKYEKPLNTPYQLFAFVATYGTRNYTPDQFPWALLGGAPTNVYDFYKKTNSSLKMVGQGITTGSLSLPASYNVADNVYNFPIHYLDKDSGVGKFSLPIPNIGFYEKKINRKNEVDGWGTLVTPYGTFNVLRMKTTLNLTDSLYLDTIQFGFTIPRQTQYEYKWFANGGKLPILEVDATQNLLGGLTIDRVNWRDSVIKPMVISATEQASCPIVNEGSLTANVAGGRYPLKYMWSTGDTTTSISNLAPGVYTLTVTDRYGNVKQFIDTVATLNDSSCLILVDFAATNTCPAAKNGSIAASVTGARLPATYQWSSGDTTLTIYNLAPGTYTLYVTDKYNRKDTATATVPARIGDASCLNIPNAFTPDGDGTNDVWKIRSLSDFGNCKVEIFNQWGSMVFHSVGYDNPWDGKYNGEPAPAGTYYYVIDLGNGSDKYNGTVTIIR